MANPVDLGTGTTITFGTSGFSAEVTEISHGSISRETIDTSHLATPAATAGKIGSKTFLAGILSDPGELTLQGHHDPSLTPPVEGDAETVTVTFPDGDTWAFSGQMTSYEYTAPLEDKMTFSATVKAVGSITVTPKT